MLLPEPTHHKLNIYRAADVLQTGHGALAFHSPAEEELVWIGQTVHRT